MLIILCGIPFAGKSTLAKELAVALDAVTIDLDEIKFSLYGSLIQDSELDQPAWDHIYQEMYQEIGLGLDAGHTVIHDTGNFTRHERSMISRLATARRIPFITVFVDTDRETAMERLAANRETKHRFDVSDRDFWAAVAEMEPPGTNENPIIYKESQNLRDLIALISV